MDLRVVLYQDKTAHTFWSIASHNEDMWEEGPYDTFEKAVDSYVRRTHIMKSLDKPEGVYESKVKVGQGKWIAKNTTHVFEDIQKKWMTKESDTLMFLTQDQVLKPYPALIQYHWNDKFGSVTNERLEEAKAMNRNFFVGVYYINGEWFFEIKCDPFLFTSKSYTSMFIAWIERELFIIQLGIENISDIHRSAPEEKLNMEKLYASLHIPRFDTTPVHVFEELYEKEDSRVILTIFV